MNPTSPYVSPTAAPIKMTKARNPYTCFDCGKGIAKGDTYLKFSRSFGIRCEICPDCSTKPAYLPKALRPKAVRNG